MRLREVNHMADVVLVIHMQRCFLEEGRPLFCGDKSLQIIPNVRKLLDQQLAQGSTIIFTADTHAPDDEEFQMWPAHCVEGTEGAEIIPELASYPGPRIHSTRYDVFYGTDLEQRLKQLRPEKIHACGVCTDICVLHTVAGARFRDYRVLVYTDAVATFDEKMHEFGIKHMKEILGAELTTVAGQIGS
jgi:nicotinamidase/pyrazinamidase